MICLRFIHPLPLQRTLSLPATALLLISQLKGGYSMGGGDCGLRDLMDLNPLILKSADCLWFASTGEHRGID